MKYIDAEKLNAEIKRRIEWLSTATNDFAEGRRAELRSLYDFVAHLQQEQLIKSELKEEKIECSPVIKEFIGKFFEVGRSYNFGFGPKDFQQEQPDVDLEKASRNVYESWMGGTMDDVRRDMVELGKALNVRKEE